MRDLLTGAGLALFVAGLLGGVAAWLVDVGHDRAMAECALAAARQNAEIAGLRRQIEEGWRDAGDRITRQEKELDDAVATVDAAAGGAAECLPADSVRALDAIR